MMMNVRACVRVVRWEEKGRGRRKRTVWYVTGCVNRVEGQVDLVFETPPACIHVKRSIEVYMRG